MKPKQRNYAAEAIETLGGPTKTANAVGVSNVTVHYWRNVGKIKDALYALQVERLTREAGKPIAPEPAEAAWLLAGGNPEDLGGRVVSIARGRAKGAKRSAPAQNRTGTYGPDEGAVDSLTVVEAQVSPEKRAA